MTVQADLCQTCSETTLLAFPRGGSFAFVTSWSKERLVLNIKRTLQHRVSYFFPFNHLVQMLKFVNDFNFTHFPFQNYLLILEFGKYYPYSLILQPRKYQLSNTEVSNISKSVVKNKKLTALEQSSRCN